MKNIFVIKTIKQKIIYLLLFLVFQLKKTLTNKEVFIPHWITVFSNDTDTQKAIYKKLIITGFVCVAIKALLLVSILIKYLLHSQKPLKNEINLLEGRILKIEEENKSMREQIEIQSKNIIQIQEKLEFWQEIGRERCIDIENLKEQNQNHDEGIIELQKTYLDLQIKIALMQNILDVNQLSDKKDSFLNYLRRCGVPVSSRKNSSFISMSTPENSEIVF
jgi:hypothetical protein